VRSVTVTDDAIIFGDLIGKLGSAPSAPSASARASTGSPSRSRNTVATKGSSLTAHCPGC